MESDLLKDYEKFVDEVTSYASKHPKNFIDEVERIEEQGVNPARLLTASVGLSGESGEFSDIVKKIVFQGKEMNEDVLRNQINSLIRDEIQEVINDYVDGQGQSEKSGLGFVQSEDDQELKVNISNKEIDRIIKEYKKIKKGKKSNLSQIKKLGLVDKHGNPLK